MNHRALLLLGAMASLPACLAGNDPAGTPEAPPDPRWELFRKSAIQIADNPVRYVFGGDMIAVGEDGLRREFERYFAPPAGAEIATASSPLTVDQASGANIQLETSSVSYTH